MDEVNKYNCNVLFVIRNLIRMNLYDLVQSTMCFHLIIALSSLHFCDYVDSQQCFTERFVKTLRKWHEELHYDVVHLRSIAKPVYIRSIADFSVMKW